MEVSGVDESHQAALDWVIELYEYDVPYVTRTMIDCKLRCGKWYEVTRPTPRPTDDRDLNDSQTTIECLKEMTVKPPLRVFAWDIECTKLPLKFPDSAYDRVTMISIMIDGSGFLIVNRAEVSEDIR